MNERGTGRYKTWTPLLFSAILITGILIGFFLRDKLRYKRDFQTIVDRNDRLEEIIDLINEKYVDSVNTNNIYTDAIGGILKHLDPHTVYIPATDVQEVNEDLEGGFFGIGVEFTIVRDTIQVTSVIDNGPSQIAGVQVGDRMIKVGDSLVAGNHVTTERIVSLLRGKQHTHVSITLEDAYTAEQRHVSIIRDIVPIFSVEAAFMADSLTGFIKINRFSATTFDEFVKALKLLKTQGMQQLIIDLRENPGGYLDAATSIADEFLDDNKLVVYTKGLHAVKTEYKAGKNGLFEHGRIAVLVDESSASASEIFSGAIQDWDRGIILGRRTFGKGLVQEQYDLSDGAALRLTIAKYYTPSGRCIQRSFANGKEAYEQDYTNRFETGELTGKDTTVLKDTMKYYTSTRRVVYGGGGIKPDVYVPYDTMRLNAGFLNLMFNDEVKGVLWDYFIRNRKKLQTYKTVDSYIKGFAGTDEMISRYIAMLKGAVHNEAVALLNKPANLQYFRNEMKAQLARFIFHDNGYYAVSVQDDNVTQKALQVLYSNNYLKLIGR